MAEAGESTSLRPTLLRREAGRGDVPDFTQRVLCYIPIGVATRQAVDDVWGYTGLVIH